MRVSFPKKIPRPIGQLGLTPRLGRLGVRVSTSFKILNSRGREMS